MWAGPIFREVSADFAIMCQNAALQNTILLLPPSALPQDASAQGERTPPNLEYPLELTTPAELVAVLPIELSVESEAEAQESMHFSFSDFLRGSLRVRTKPSTYDVERCLEG